MRECCKLLQYLEARFPGRRFLLTLYSRIDSRQLSIVRPIGLVTTQLSMLMYSTLSNLDSDVLQQNRLHGWVGGRGQPYRRGASTLHWLLLALRFPDPRPMQCKSIRICLLIHLSNLCKWIHDAINSASQTYGGRACGRPLWHSSDVGGWFPRRRSQITHNHRCRRSPARNSKGEAATNRSHLLQVAPPNPFVLHPASLSNITVPLPFSLCGALLATWWFHKWPPFLSS